MLGGGAHVRWPCGTMRSQQALERACLLGVNLSRQKASRALLKSFLATMLPAGFGVSDDLLFVSKVKLMRKEFSTDFLFPSVKTDQGRRMQVTFAPRECGRRRPSR